MSNYYIFAKP